MFPKAVPLHSSSQFNFTAIFQLPLFYADNPQICVFNSDLFTEYKVSLCLPSKGFYLDVIPKMITFSSKLVSPSNFSCFAHASSTLICIPHQDSNFILLCLNLFCTFLNSSSHEFFQSFFQEYSQLYLPFNFHNYEVHWAFVINTKTASKTSNLTSLILVSHTLQ